MRFGIIIATYRRADGRTPELLRRALDSVFKQNHPDFQAYLIGDHYEPEEEFWQIAKEYPLLRAENLSFAAERDKYKGSILWTCGGTYAQNYGASIAFEHYLCFLDHDDYWHPDHLFTIDDCIKKTNAVWICTQSKHISGIIPEIPHTTRAFPSGGCLVKSSACFNTRIIPLRFRNVYEETGTPYPGDADLWNRMKEYMLQHSLVGYAIKKVTCVHDEEGYSYKGGNK